MRLRIVEPTVRRRGRAWNRTGLDVTTKLKLGKNWLVIKVTNLLINRVRASRCLMSARWSRVWETVWPDRRTYGPEVYSKFGEEHRQKPSSFWPAGTGRNQSDSQCLDIAAPPH